MTMQKKITLTISLIGLVLGLILSLMVYVYLDNKLVNQKVAEITKLSIEQVHETSMSISNYKLIAKMLGTRTRVVELLADSQNEFKKHELTKIFTDYTADDASLLAIYLLDKNGVGLVSTDPRFVGQDYSFRNYFRDAIKGKPVSDVLIGKTSNQFGYYFSHPVKNDSGEVIGVLVVKVDNKAIDKDISHSEITDSNTVMLVDEFGIILYSTNPDRYLKSLGKLTEESKKNIFDTQRLLGKNIEALHYDSAQQIINEKQTLGVVKFYDDVDEETEIVSVTKLGDHPFYMVSEIGVEKIEDLVLSTITIIILMIIVIILIFSLIIYEFIIKFMKPLKDFRILSKAISNGDFTQRIDIKSHDEFGDMATAFNEMTAKLKESYSILQSKINERTLELENEKNSLEVKIKSRTVELEHLKTNLENEIHDRTLNLNDKLDELKQINKLMVGRELAMIKLKEELNECRSSKSADKSN